MPKWTKNQVHTWGNSDDALTELWIYSIARKSLKHTDKQVKIYTGLIPAGLPYLTLNIFEEQEKRVRIFNPLISGVKHEMQQNFALMVGRGEHKHPPQNLSFDLQQVNITGQTSSLLSASQTSEGRCTNRADMPHFWPLLLCPLESVTPICYTKYKSRWKEPGARAGDSGSLNCGWKVRKAEFKPRSIWT